MATRSKRQSKDLVVAFAVERCLGDDFQIPHELTNRDRKLMREVEPGEGFGFRLPRRRADTESDVLCNHYTPKLRCAEQQGLVIKRGGAIIVSCENIHASAPQLICHRLRNVNIHVKASRHSKASLGAETLQEVGGWSDLTIALGLRKLGLQFHVNLLLVVKIICHRGMRFGKREIRMLAAHFLRRPAVGKVIGDDLRDTQSRYAFETGGLGTDLTDMRICD
jgi:hypothetical protein